MSETQKTNEEVINEAMKLDPEEMRMLGVVEHKEEELKTPLEETEKEAEEVKAETEVKTEETPKEEVSIKISEEKAKSVDNEVKEKEITFSEVDLMKVKAEVKLFDKSLQSIEKDAAWYKEQYEETQDNKFADKYNEKAAEYNEVIKERTEALDIIKDVEVKTETKKILAEYLGEMGKDGKSMVEYVEKALKNPPPYTKDAFTLSERIWAKALRLKEAGEIAKKAETIEKEKAEKTTAAKQVLKQVGNNTGTGTGSNDTTNWAEVQKKANKGDRQAMRQLMNREDPILKAMMK